MVSSQLNFLSHFSVYAAQFCFFKLNILVSFLSSWLKWVKMENEDKVHKVTLANFFSNVTTERSQMIGHDKISVKLLDDMQRFNVH